MLKHLLQPGRIGTLEIRNRILMSPMGSNLAERSGQMGDRIKAYYEERARGGVGLIIVGVGAISFPAGACNPNQVAISDDAFVPELSDFCRRVHRHGARVAIQLQHAGKIAVRDIEDGRPMWVPSVVPAKPSDLTTDLTPEELGHFVKNLTQPGAKLLYHEMTKDDIAQLVGLFADAAERAQRAGFDAVELHAGHGYLLSSFLSPASNRRQDEYGGPIENRARLLMEVIRAVKQRVGAGFPVWCRIDAREFHTPGGISEADGQRAAELAEQAGADAIHVSAYADASSGAAFTDAPLVHRPCGYVEFAAAIKRRVGIPVIAVGRIEPEEADALIAAGKADFVAMARKLLADPELPKKLLEDRPQDVRPCIYCYTCVGQIFLNQASCCVVNPASGREVELPLLPAERPRRVLVVGGGPAGMEAARIAALRGHQVTLCEKERRLGGTALLSSLVYEVNGRLVTWLERQLRELAVDVRLGFEVTAERVRELAPEVTLVAVGARRETPAIPGVERSLVLSGDALRELLGGAAGPREPGPLTRPQRALLGLGRRLGLTGHMALARRLSKHWMPLGARVVVIGGGLVGVELAEFLAERGRSVSVIEEGATFGAELAPPRRWRLLHALREHGVRLVSRARVEAIEEDTVVYVDAGGARGRCEADAVILAVGARPDPRLGESLAALGGEVHRIGDCAEVGYIKGAMLDAARVARAI